MQKTTRPRESAARSYTINMKYKTVFKRCNICKYENCMVGFVDLGHGFASSGMCRMRLELMLRFL